MWFVTRRAQEGLCGYRFKNGAAAVLASKSRKAGRNSEAN